MTRRRPAVRRSRRAGERRGMEPESPHPDSGLDSPVSSGRRCTGACAATAIRVECPRADPFRGRPTSLTGCRAAIGSRPSGVRRTRSIPTSSSARSWRTGTRRRRAPARPISSWSTPARSSTKPARNRLTSSCSSPTGARRGPRSSSPDVSPSATAMSSPLRCPRSPCAASTSRSPRTITITITHTPVRPRLPLRRSPLAARCQCHRSIC